MTEAIRLQIGLVLAMVLGGCHGAASTIPYQLRPGSGSFTLDLTDAATAHAFLARSRPFHRSDNAHAGETVVAEFREGVGVCLAVTKKYHGLSDGIEEAYLSTPDNKFGTGKPIPQRVVSEQDRGQCFHCTGITIPYFTPRRISVSVSSINIAEDNLGQLFPAKPEVRSELPLATPASRGFIGLLTRVPAREEGDNVIAFVTPESRFEFVYLRPANGDSTPGRFSAGNPHTTVQFGAMFFEWFLLRSRAFKEQIDSSGKPVRLPVFEGVAETLFGDTVIQSLSRDMNRLELFLDSGNQQRVVVNGKEVVSNVTGQPFDRTLLGSYTPNSNPKTLNVLYVEPGVYGCVRRIDLEF